MNYFYEGFVTAVYLRVAVHYARIGKASDEEENEGGDVGETRDNEEDEVVKRGEEEGDVEREVEDRWDGEDC